MGKKVFVINGSVLVVDADNQAIGITFDVEYGEITHGFGVSEGLSDLFQVLPIHCSNNVIPVLDLTADIRKLNGVSTESFERN
jgi:hypothetical protein